LVVLLLLLLGILADTAIDGRCKGGPITEETVERNDDGAKNNKRRRKESLLEYARGGRTRKENAGRIRRLANKLATTITLGETGMQNAAAAAATD